MESSPRPSSPKPEEDHQSSNLATFWQELKRRKVMRVAIAYAVVAWLLEGGVQRGGDEIRINAQLIEVANEGN